MVQLAIFVAVVIATLLIAGVYGYFSSNPKLSATASIPTTTTFTTSTTSIKTTTTIPYINSTPLSGLVAASFPFSISNTPINTLPSNGISVANTVLSGGSQSSYTGQWTVISPNALPSVLTSTYLPTGATGITIEGAISPSGKEIFVTEQGGGAHYSTVNVIDVATNALVKTIVLSGTCENPDQIAFAPNGKEAFFGCSQSTAGVGVIDVATNTVSYVSGFSGPTGVAVSPSGKQAYITNYGGANNVVVLDVASNTIVANSVKIGTDSPYYVSVSPSGKQVYTVTLGAGDNVIVYDVATNTIVKTIGVGNTPYSAQISPSGKELYVTNHVDDTISVVDVASNTVVKTITVGTNRGGQGGFGYASKLTFNPDGSLAYVADHGNANVVVVDVATNTVIQTLKMGSNPRDMLMAPDGDAIYAVDYASSGNDVVNVIKPLLSTSFNVIPTSSNSMKLAINTITSNTLELTFQDVSQIINTGTTNVIAGIWSVYMGVYDNGTSVYYYGSNSIFASNTFTVDK